MKKSNGKFLFPVKALSIVFKAKLLAAICKLYKNGTISAPETVQNFYDWINSMHKKKWVVYAKKPVPKGVSIVEYLAKYTHKVAISNSRIIKFENKVVTFSYLDYRTSKIVIMEIGIDEFIRRFLMHMLPKGFVKIRYYGFLSNRNKKAILVRIRVQIGQSPAQNFKGLP